MAEPSQFPRVSFPALLGAARNSYDIALRDALDEAGFDDLPRQGPFLLSAIAPAGAALGDLVKQLALSKQVAGQLVDALVTRRYLDRSTNPRERRRLMLSLTKRGQAAAAIIRQVVKTIDAEIVKEVPREYIGHTKATLAAIARVNQR